MNKWVAATGISVFLGLAGCGTPPGPPETSRAIVNVKAVSVEEAAAVATKADLADQAPQAPLVAPLVAPPRDVYHEKFASFAYAEVNQIEVQPKVFRTGAPIEFRVSGSLPNVNDQIESVETKVDLASRTVKISVVVRRPAIRLPMVGKYDVKATFVPPAAGQYVLQVDGIRTTVVVNECEQKVAGA